MKLKIQCKNAKICKLCTQTSKKRNGATWYYLSDAQTNFWDQFFRGPFGYRKDDKVLLKILISGKVNKRQKVMR